jgi:hypothetical protein
MSTSIVDKIDQLLKDNAFDTRAGLRFMGELVKDLFKFIDEERAKNKAEVDRLESFEFRLKNMETGLHDWMELRRKEADKADDERKFYRRAVLGGLISLILSQIVNWIIG